MSAEFFLSTRDPNFTDWILQLLLTDYSGCDSGLLVNKHTKISYSSLIKFVTVSTP
jgi:hypothetical protein